MRGGKIDTTGKIAPVPGRWPAWAKVVATLAMLYHASAVWAGAWASAPSSRLERDLDDLFDGYQQLVGQGYSPRYYSPEPPPTPVITAVLSFADGRPEKTVRLPERGTWPRLRYQRQLALASGLMVDVQDAQAAGGDASKSRWAHAFKTNLCKTNPGCASVTLHRQLHLIPNPERVKQLLEAPGAGPVDLDAEEFYTAPERIGVFPCDAS